MKKGFKLSDIAKQHHKEASLKAHARLHYQVGEKNSRYGAKVSDETKLRISKALKQRYLEHPETKPTGEKNGMFGKKQKPESIEKGASKRRGQHYHTEKHKNELSEKFKKFNPMDTPEARKKRSESLKGKLILDKNPNWRGGISFEPYCIKFNNEFRERVRTFFGHVCVECGTPQNGRQLAVHHINYDKNVCCNDRKPLFIALCNSCNSKANKNRSKWEKYYTEMIEGYYQEKCYLSKEEMKRLTQAHLYPYR